MLVCQSFSTGLDIEARARLSWIGDGIYFIGFGCESRVGIFIIVFFGGNAAFGGHAVGASDDLYLDDDEFIDPCGD